MTRSRACRKSKLKIFKNFFLGPPNILHHLNQIEYLSVEFDVDIYDPVNRKTIEEHLDDEILTVDYTSVNPQG